MSTNRTLTHIFDDRGLLTSDSRKILDTTRSYYAEVYGGEPLEPARMDEMDWGNINIPQISEEDRNRLEEPYSEQELHSALKKMNVGKCPTLMGYRWNFISDSGSSSRLHCWSVFSKA